LLIIGAVSPDAGRATVACRIAERCSARKPVVGVKVTTSHEQAAGVCPCEARERGVYGSFSGSFVLPEERSGSAGKDTTRPAFGREGLASSSALGPGRGRCRERCGRHVCEGRVNKLPEGYRALQSQVTSPDKAPDGATSTLTLRKKNLACFPDDRTQRDAKLGHQSGKFRWLLCHAGKPWFIRSYEKLVLLRMRAHPVDLATVNVVHTSYDL